MADRSQPFYNISHSCNKFTGPFTSRGLLVGNKTFGATDVASFDQACMYRGNGVFLRSLSVVVCRHSECNSVDITSGSEEDMGMGSDIDMFTHNLVSCERDKVRTRVQHSAIIIPASAFTQLLIINILTRRGDYFRPQGFYHGRTSGLESGPLEHVVYLSDRGGATVHRHSLSPASVPAPPEQQISISELRIGFLSPFTLRGNAHVHIDFGLGVAK